MSGKLDQSLDTILAARKKSAARNGRPRRAAAAKATTAPVGGVKKPTKAPKKADKPVPTGPSKTESKIMVSNLPSDVTEAQIKDYCQRTVAPVKRIILAYGPNGQSRGIATVIFGTAAAAAKAVPELNGVKVDGKPMKVEVILDAKDAPAPAEPKALADRITQPKNTAKPKPATQTKPKAGTAGRRKGKGPAGRGGAKRAGGRVKKTAEELDAEMTDYFQTNTGETNGAAATAAPASADTNMDDDI